MADGVACEAVCVEVLREPVGVDTARILYLEERTAVGGGWSESGAAVGEEGMDLAVPLGFFLRLLSPGEKEGNEVRKVGDGSLEGVSLRRLMVPLHISFLIYGFLRGSDRADGMAGSWWGIMRRTRCEQDA